MLAPAIFRLKFQHTASHFLRRKQAGQQNFLVLLPQTFYNNSTLIKLLDIEMTRKQSTDKDVSLKGFKISENDYGARSVEMKRRSALFETAQRSILDQVTGPAPMTYRRSLMLCGSHVEHCLREGPATWLHRVACRGWQVRLARVESVSLSGLQRKKWNAISRWSFWTTHQDPPRY